jgi:hypothetical protein
MRIVPKSASDITVVDRNFAPAVLSTPVAVSNGTATFSVANLGLYLVMIDDGLYMEVGKFDIDPAASVNSPYHELYGLKKGMAFTLADPQFSVNTTNPYVANAYRDVNGNLIFQRTDGFNINVGQIGGTPGTTTVSAQTASYILTSSDYAVVFNGTGLTATLPDPTTTLSGRIYAIKNINASALTVVSAGTSKTIDGAASASIPQWGALEFVSDGTQWLVRSDRLTSLSSSSSAATSNTNTFTTVTANYTVTATDRNILCNASAQIIVTLPDPTTAAANRNITLRNISGNNVLIGSAGTTPKIDALTVTGGNYASLLPYNGVTLFSDGTQWWSITSSTQLTSGANQPTVNSSGNFAFGQLAINSTGEIVTLGNASSSFGISNSQPAIQTNYGLRIGQAQSNASPGRLWYKASGANNTVGWASVTAYSGYATKTANYTLVSADELVVFNGASLTATLPDPTGYDMNGHIFTVKNINASALTVVSAGTSKTIDGAASASIPQWGSLEFVSDGTQWLVRSDRNSGSGSSGGSYAYTTYTTTNGTYNVQATDKVVIMNAQGASVVLPDPSSAASIAAGWYVIKHIYSGGGTVNVSSAGTSKTIDGKSSIKLTYNSVLTVYTDGTQWQGKAAPGATAAGNYVDSSGVFHVANQLSAATGTYFAVDGANPGGSTALEISGNGDIVKMSNQSNSYFHAGSGQPSQMANYGLSMGWAGDSPLSRVWAKTWGFNQSWGWAPVTGSRMYATKTANYTLTTTDEFVAFNGTSLTAILPDPTGQAMNGRVYIIKNLNSTSLTASSAGTSKTIDGSTTLTLPQWAALEVISDGTQWLTIPAANATTGASNGTYSSVVTTTANYNMTAANRVVFANGSGITISLPDPTTVSTNSGPYIVKNVSTATGNVVYVNSQGTSPKLDSFVNGTANLLPWSSGTYVSDGTQWFSVGSGVGAAGSLQVDVNGVLRHVSHGGSNTTAFAVSYLNAYDQFQIDGGGNIKMLGGNNALVTTTSGQPNYSVEYGLAIGWDQWAGAPLPRLWFKTYSGAGGWSSVMSSMQYYTKTANYTLTATDEFVAFNGTSLTATLPDPTSYSMNGRIFSVKNINSSALTVVSAGTSKTIDGAASVTLNQWGGLELISDGTQWLIRSKI